VIAVFNYDLVPDLSYDVDDEQFLVIGKSYKATAKEMIETLVEEMER
jgi:hypothetical protein